MTSQRASIPAATEAAIWALSNGRCYFDSCPEPVVKEVRPKTYQKNAMVAHVYGVMPRSPRYSLLPPGEDRNSFKFLLLLCYAHHNEVDDRRTGEKLYPPDRLLAMKQRHEGDNTEVLASLGPISDEQVSELLLDVFEPPIARLERIADQLEEAGTASADTLTELRQLISAVSDPSWGVDRSTAASLAYSAEILSTANLDSAASGLAYAAEVLSNLDLAASAAGLSTAGQMLNPGQLAEAAQSLATAADILSNINIGDAASKFSRAATIIADNNGRW
ncbi:hypothetical protein KZ829_23520 [Actinoplanes hulinensis]|uniref:HNH endonuclease n=1 Tax=Actinoplanes hulinensis TaxID=1144547 RepID=A0ABS7B7V6_9ACTN|nr:hypothetical protein [Actinoplanes hulinensis]MBW6436716.1 hypothetical protein [Actinoplanes hulinensis]